ncbi:MAG: hypothetical protein H7Y86_01220 [Rhizobacter sp.]|nr:hypothetical protein [Ferruginibacter sp.]
MKTIFLACITLLSAVSLISFAQKDVSAYEVIYEYTEALNNNIKIDDNIEMVIIDSNGDTAKSNIKRKVDKNLFDLTFKIVTLGTDSSATVKLDYSNSGQRIQTHLKMPDKLVWKSSKWYSYSGPNVKIIPEIFYTMIKIDSFKTILGYSCQQFSIIEMESKNRFDVWLTRELPNTLMPGAGYKPFPGAVLEMDFPDRKAQFIAREIKRI